MECPCSCFCTKSQDFRYVWTSLKKMNSPRENDDSFDDLNTNLKRPLQSSGLAFNTAFATNASRLCGSSQVKPRRILTIVLSMHFLCILLFISHYTDCKVGYSCDDSHSLFSISCTCLQSSIWLISKVFFPASFIDAPM